MTHLPIPQTFDIEAHDAETQWKHWKKSWEYYVCASELDEKKPKVQVATLLTIMGEDCRRIFETFNIDQEDINTQKVLDKFNERIEPQNSTIFERCLFQRRDQETAETLTNYITELRILSKKCEFENITPEEILRDRIISGMKDNELRKRILSRADVNLDTVIKLCKVLKTAASQAEAFESKNQINAIYKKKQVNTRPNSSEKYKCKKCGETHEKRSCPAYGKTCYLCKRSNHYAKMCTAQKNYNTQKGYHTANAAQKNYHTQKETHTTNTVYQIQEDEPEIYLTTTLMKEETITLNTQWNTKLRLQIDTGANVNVITLTEYKRISGDVNGQKIEKNKFKNITAFGNKKWPIIGERIIEVQRRENKIKLRLLIVEGGKFHSILGRRACLALQLIKILDSDARICQVEEKQNKILEKYHEIFNEELGVIKGKYTIKLNEKCNPVKHCQRTVAAPLQEKVLEKIKELEERKIIKKVTKPTEWISSMVVTRKKDNTVRICLDPKELNLVIQREHFPLPTIESITPKLNKAKFFTVMDVKDGFWHIELDRKSQELTTFNTPWGRYMWKRLPFGICSAPEVFQRRMTDMVEGLKGVEVIADDFLIIGYGDTEEEASENHDNNVIQFLETCKKNNIKLNRNKIRWKKKEVQYSGHTTTSRGLKPGEGKISAIENMPTPEDKSGVRRILGMIQYLEKFLPRLANKTNRMRLLTKKSTKWNWGKSEDEEFKELKKIVAASDTLKYYDVNKEVTIQCDASQYGLGATLMQEGQPIAYASKALNETQQRYAIIEKELLAVLFACSKFDFYIYGKPNINIQSDHKPLEVLTTKPINEITTRLQRMMMSLQRYDIKVKYTPGKTMYIADTLSRAPEDNADINTIEEEIDLSTLAISPDRLKRIQEATINDNTSHTIKELCRNGWPKLNMTPEEAKDYYSIRSIITSNDNLIFKEDKLIVPLRLRNEMLNVAHAYHGGIGACLRRIREVMYWPGMSKEMYNTVKRCETCRKFAINNKGNQPMIQPEIGETPWEKLGIDLCEVDGRQLLVVIDYYSSYISVARLKKTSKTETNQQLMNLFAIHGIPQKIVSDNGPQFRSEYEKFARELDIEIIHSSPLYPKSNGKAESAVKIVKSLFKKCKDAKRSEQLSILDWNNTISEGEKVSPSEKLFGRKARTLLPIHKNKLKPRDNRREEIETMKEKKNKQREYYDRSIREYNKIEVEDSIQIKLPNQKTWTKGRCIESLDNRKYKVEVKDTEYIRNRKDIKKLNEEENEEIRQEGSDNESKKNNHEIKTNIDYQRPQRKRWLPNKLGGGLITK